MKISLEHAGLDNTGSQPVTAQLQQIIDTLGAAGGGTLTVPPGIWLTGTLVLPSHFTLHLEAGACLRASPNAADYPADLTQSMAELSHMALLYARNQRQVTLSGEGRIEGNARAWFADVIDDQGYRQPAPQRPRLLVLEGCEQVRICDITLADSPMWTAHLVCCNHVFIHRLTIDNDLALPNTDALDLDSCQFVHISDSYFSAADDAICLKTTRKTPALQQPTRHVMVSNCIMRSKSCAIKIGTETVADISHIVVSNCTIFESNRGIGLLSRDGGEFSQMSFSNILFDCRHAHPCHWGKADPIYLSARRRDPQIPAGQIKQITFSQLSGISEGAINLHSETPGDIHDITFDGIQFQQRENAAQEQGCYDIRPPCNPARPTGMGLDNAYLVNPQTGRAWGVERYPDGLPVLFADGVAKLTLRSLNVQRPVPLPAGWNPCEVVMVNEIHD
jgi:Endopolygalacturonase